MREYKTQMEAAKKGIITPEMKTVAKKEYTDAETIRAKVAEGCVCIPANINHTALSAEGIGSGPVSYTHLTLPTTSRVLRAGGGG